MSLFFFVPMFGCSTPEEQAQNILQNLSEDQIPCSVLRDGEQVPPNIQLGACSEGKTVHLTLHRECTNGTSVHNNELGWWTDDAIFHKGVPPESIVVNCEWK